MKKYVSFLLVVIVFFTFSFVSFCEIDKLKGHWSYDEVDEKFVQSYFSYLAAEDYKKFTPNGTITISEFEKSFEKLLEDYGYSYERVASNEKLSRKKMACMVGEKLIREGIIEKSLKDVSFKDIKDLPKDEKVYISSLCEKDILKGKTKDTFDLESSVTQVECIIVLERVKGVLESMFKNTVPFRVIGSEQSNSSVDDEVRVEDFEKHVEVAITEMFPTPGYSMTVDKIVKENEGNYTIYLSTIPPKEGSILPQVITYKTVVIEVDKSYLGEGPYIFKVERDSFSNTISGKVLQR